MDHKLKDITVLVTAAGAPGAAGIIKSLRLNGERIIRIVSCDMNPESAGFFLADQAFTVPPGNSDLYVPQLVELARNEKIDVILPLATDELMPLALNKALFSKVGTKIALSDPQQLEIANNKGKLYRYLAHEGISTPSSLMVNSIDQLHEAVFKLGYPDQPVCIKPQVSKGGRGFRVLNTHVNRLEILLNHKPDSTITTLEEITSILKEAVSFPPMVVMEYLPGAEYSVDLLVKKGEVLAAVPRRRDSIKLGISFIGTVENNEALEQQSRQIAKVLELDFNINMQFKCSNKGLPKIIEINPRVSGTIIMSVGAGINLPYLGVKLALGEIVAPISPVYGTRMLRFWDEVFIDANAKPFRLGIDRS